MTPIDELELELRQLGGVRFVGAVESPAGVVIQLGLEDEADQASVVAEARRLAELHIAGSIRVEVATLSGDGPPLARASRVQLLVVLPWPERREIEVHLAHEGRRTVGRAPNGDLIQVAVATIRALEALGRHVPFEVRAAARLDELSSTSIVGGTDVVGVALESKESESPRFGAASGRTHEEAAARATLHALNRYLEASS